MITYKVILDERRAKADGKYAIAFRLTHNRSTSYFYLGLTAMKEHWNASASLLNNHCPNFKELNKNLTTKFLSMQKILLGLEDNGEFSIEAFKEKVLDKPEERKRNVDFKNFAQQLIKEQIEVKRTGNAIVYQTAVNRLLNYCNKPQLRFEEITYTFLDDFKRHLTKDGVKPNTIGNYLRSIRAIYNKAIKAKLVDRSKYPFTEISIKTERTAKRAIVVDDLKKLYNLELKVKSKEWHARNLFFISYTLIGMSFTDLAYIQGVNIARGRIAYKRRKTHKQYNIKLTSLCRQLLSNYTADDGYLLRVISNGTEEDTLRAKQLIHQWIKTTNKHLNRIGKRCGIENLTTYVARHTWATTAKRLGYSNELIAESMGHEYGNKITNIYLDNFEQSVIDDVNEKVVGLITI